MTKLWQIDRKRGNVYFIFLRPELVVPFSEKFFFSILQHDTTKSNVSYLVLGAC